MFLLRPITLLAELEARTDLARCAGRSKRIYTAAMFRCLACGCSRFDQTGIGCGLCGKAMGLRSEECYVSEDTRSKLLAHSEGLTRWGIALDEVQTVSKSADTKMAAAALVLSLADSLHHGVLHDLVRYLHDELLIPRDEILRLRLSEPEEVDQILNNGPHDHGEGDNLPDKQKTV